MKFFLCLLLAALALETATYACILRWPPRPAQDEKFDLLAVFGGDPERVRLAVQLGREGVGRALVVSDSSPEQLARYFRAYGSPGKAEVVLEPYARSTDQNARLVGRIIRQRGFGKVLLITSWFHQPRAYLLLRLSLLGSSTELRMLSTEPAPPDFYAAKEFRGELLKFWGSLGRWSKSLLRKHGFIPGSEPLPVD